MYNNLFNKNKCVNISWLLILLMLLFYKNPVISLAVAIDLIDTLWICIHQWIVEPGIAVN